MHNCIASSRDIQLRDSICIRLHYDHVRKMLIIQKLSKFDLKVSTSGEVTTSGDKEIHSFIIYCESVKCLVEVLLYFLILNPLDLVWLVFIVKNSYCPLYSTASFKS